MNGEHLSAGDLFEELGEPLAEARSAVIVPKRGPLISEENTMRVAIIRPCVSRGKKIKGLPPIYTPRMLEENAAVFTGWPMYEDHLAEQAVENFSEMLAEANLGHILEFLQERARKIKELGGRVRKSFWNSDITFADDGERGYRPGGIEGEVVVQPRVRQMLEADPEILNVSINAWPSGARPGTAPWDPGTKGMVIEGIRSKPMGSVDWVFRGGAGGRPLLTEHDREMTVSVLEAMYAAKQNGDPLDQRLMSELQEMKPEQLREYLQEHAPQLIPALAPEGDNGGSSTTGITAEQLQEALDQQAERFETKLSERENEVEEKVQERLAERTQAQTLAAKAAELISEAERNGLPRDTWGADLRRRYSVLPSGPADGLLLQESDLVDGDTEKELTAEEAIERRVREDVAHCSKLIEAAGGRPLISGLGPAAPDPGGDSDSHRQPSVKESSLRDFLKDSGLLKLKEGESEDDAIRRLVKEGQV